MSRPDIMTPDRAAERMALYRAGKSDCEIARIQGCYSGSVWNWRKLRGLPANPFEQARGVREPYLGPRSEDQRIADYRSGLNDRQLSERWGVSKTRVSSWRKGRGLPKNHRSARLTTEGHAARILLYSFGYSDGRIAAEQGLARNTIRSWRARWGLDANASDKPDLQRRGHRRTETAMLDRIKAALPKYLSPADRDDAASDLFLAVMSGAIPIAEIEARARRFGNRVIEQYASKWGPRSLDEEIGDDGDGFAMIDLIRDHSHSSWLEEMGATVW